MSEYTPVESLVLHFDIMINFVKEMRVLLIDAMGNTAVHPVVMGRQKTSGQFRDPIKR